MKKVIPMRTRVRSVLGGAGLIAIVALGLAACGQTPASPSGGRTGPAPSRPAPASTHAAVPTTPAAPSEATRLAAFFAAAEQADGQLHHAAALVNGGIGTTSMRFTPATLAAVRAVGLAPVASAIPAGLPAGLLRAALVVYGDLSSRTWALNGVREYGFSGRALPIGGPEAKSVLRGLRNGAPAAARFGGDLAAAHTLAQQSPLVTAAAPDSRAAAELALRLQSIGLQNGCSDQFGGYAPTSLEPVIWQPSTDQHSGRYEGTINQVRFQANYTAQHGWQIIIYAC
jgi:hypothetical protein